MNLNFRNFLEQQTFVSYTGIVLHSADQQRLISHVETMIPENWKIEAHHMTCNMRGAEEGPATDWLGKEVELIAKTISKDNKVVAVGVDTEVPSVNRIKHITIAISPEGRPADSRDLTNWEPITTLKIRGVVKEVRMIGQERQPPKRPPSQPAPDNPEDFVKLMVGKAPKVIRRALKGKFPLIPDEQIDALCANLE
jgi:hypothetical protein